MDERELINNNYLNYSSLQCQDLDFGPGFKKIFLTNVSEQGNLALLAMFVLCAFSESLVPHVPTTPTAVLVSLFADIIMRFSEVTNIRVVCT